MYGVLVVAALVTGCSSSGSAPGTAPTTASTTPSASPTGAALPAGVHDLPAAEERMSPGRYTFTPFEPQVVFRVGKGWEAGHELVEFFDIWYGEDTTFGFANPDFVAGADGRVDVAGLPPREVVEVLATNPDFVEHHIVGRVDVGELSGPAIEFRSREGGEIFGGPEGEYHTVQQSVRALIVALDVDGEIVLAMEMSLHPPHAAHRRLIETVADTVRFTP
jgi:hypothetical protein